MQKRIECNITGRVQMVMYRDFANRKARKLGLTGAVKNNDDGSVSVIAEGEEAILKKYIQDLWRGSVLAAVENVECEWKEATNEYVEFNIVYK